MGAAETGRSRGAEEDTITALVAAPAVLDFVLDFVLACIHDDDIGDVCEILVFDDDLCVIVFLVLCINDCSCVVVLLSAELLI